jgi:hypothetical protein
VRFVIVVRYPFQLERAVIRSDVASLSIPCLDFENPAGVGRFAPLRKLLQDMFEATITALAASGLDRKTLADFEAKSKSLLSVEYPFKVILEDPAGISQVETLEDDETGVSREYFMRSHRQNCELGLRQDSNGDAWLNDLSNIGSVYVRSSSSSDLKSELNVGNAQLFTAMDANLVNSLTPSLTEHGVEVLRGCVPAETAMHLAQSVGPWRYLFEDHLLQPGEKNVSRRIADIPESVMERFDIVTPIIDRTARALGVSPSRLSRGGWVQAIYADENSPNQLLHCDEDPLQSGILKGLSMLVATSAIFPGHGAPMFLLSSHRVWTTKSSRDTVETTPFYPDMKAGDVVVFRDDLLHGGDKASGPRTVLFIHLNVDGVSPNENQVVDVLSRKLNVVKEDGA